MPTYEPKMSLGKKTINLLLWMNNMPQIQKCIVLKNADHSCDETLMDNVILLGDIPKNTHLSIKNLYLFSTLELPKIGEHTTIAADTIFVENLEQLVTIPECIIGKSKKKCTPFFFKIKNIMPLYIVPLIYIVNNEEKYMGKEEFFIIILKSQTLHKSMHKLKYSHFCQ